MPNDPQQTKIDEAVNAETQRCAKLVELHLDMVSDPTDQHLLVRILNFILDGRSATSEAIGFNPGKEIDRA